jgi:CBS domain-containing protein
MTKVRDVMKADVFTLSPETPLKKAAFELEAQFISGAPVVDAAGTLVGILTQADLVETEHRGSHVTVGDVMTTEVHTADPDAPAREVVQTMVDRDVHRMVITRGGRVEGIVTTMDILRAVLRGVRLDS